MIRRLALVLGVALGLVAAACGSDGGGGDPLSSVPSNERLLDLNQSNQSGEVNRSPTTSP